MFKKSDPYTFRRLCNLTKDGTPIGTVAFEYQVSHYDDLLVYGVESINRPAERRYMVTCTQRINVFNPAGSDVSPIEPPNVEMPAYTDYPVLLDSSLLLTLPSGTMELVDYTPQTINTVVQSSGTSGISETEGQSSSVSKTVGSSTSQTNTYGGSVNISETPGLSLNYEHASTTTHDRSRTASSDSSSGSSSDTSSSATMSVKDWGGYALVDPGTCSPTWVFGQEYPWSAIDCRLTDGKQTGPDPKQVRIIIPNTMAERLWDGVSLYPPSQLAMFGVNFVMKAQWLAIIPNGSSPIVGIDSTIYYFAASHNVYKEPGTQFMQALVYMDPAPTALVSADGLSTQINLALMALDPLGFQGSPAIVGLVAGKFAVPPAPGSGGTPALFQTFASSNTLFVEDTTGYPVTPGDAGFTASETGLTATFSAACPALTMTAYFKVADAVGQYILRMKHWKTLPTGVMLTFVFNGDPTSKVTKYVDELETEGGEDNLLTILLRSQNFAGNDYHDYLQLGLNSAAITIQPLNDTDYSTCGYQLLAMSIENG